MRISLILLSVACLVPSSDQERAKTEEDGPEIKLPIVSIDKVKDVGEYFERFRNKETIGSNSTKVLEVEVRPQWIYDDDSSNETKYFPPRIVVDVILQDGNKTLNLTERIPLDDSSTVSEDESSNSSDSGVEFRGYYKDDAVNAIATVIVKKVSKEVQEIYYLISFGDWKTTYDLIPADFMRGSGEYTLLNINGMPHAFKISPAIQDCYEGQLAVIKSFLIADQSVFKKFMSTESSELSDSDRARKAKEKILSCFHKILETTGGIVKDLENEYTTFLIRNVDNLVAQNEELPFMEQAKIDDDNIDGNRALEALSNWYSAEIAGSHSWSPNLVVVLTSYNIVNYGKKQSGIGVFNSICANNSLAILHFNPITKTSKALAKQIAHTLGIPNDGEQNECSSEENFIMGNEESFEEIFGYNLHFSKCSVAAFEKIIGKLSAIDDNCLMYSYLPDFPKQANVKFEDLDLNSQCGTVVGSTSAYCGDQNGEDMCRNIMCNHGENTQCFRFPIHVYDGTSCNNGSCLEGVCRSGGIAPIAQWAEIKSLLIMDHSIYKKFTSMENPELPEREKATKANEKITLYFDSVMADANDICKEFDKDYLMFRISTVNQFIAEDVDDVPFLEKAKIDNHSIDGDVALELVVEDWLSDKKTILHTIGWSDPNFVIIFTSYKIWSKGKKKTGVTFVEGICTPQFFAIISFEEVFSTSKAVSKYVAKFLGIREDGDLNDCSPEDSFVMGNHEYSKDTFHNSVHFSNCSIEQFHEIIKRSKDNCLVYSWPEPDMEVIRIVQIGRIYDLEDQCQMLFGTDSYYCGDKHDQDLCQYITCHDGKECMKYPMFPAYDGTACLNGTCLKGVCSSENIVSGFDDDM